VTHFKADLGKAVFSRLLYGKTRTKVKKEEKVAPARVAPKKRLDTADHEVEIIKLFFLFGDSRIIHTSDFSLG
jgi:hypothetical protein